MEWSGVVVVTVFQADRRPRGPEPVSVRASSDRLDLSGPESRLVLNLNDECRVAPTPHGPCVLYTRSDGTGYRIVFELEDPGMVECLRRSGRVFLDFLRRVELQRKLLEGAVASTFSARYEGKEVVVMIARTDEGKRLLLQESNVIHRGGGAMYIEPRGIYEISVKRQPCLALVYASGAADAA